jgi:hypothetical protein
MGISLKKKNLIRQFLEGKKVELLLEEVNTGPEDLAYKSKSVKNMLENSFFDDCSAPLCERAGEYDLNAKIDGKWWQIATRDEHGKTTLNFCEDEANAEWYESAVSTADDLDGDDSARIRALAEAVSDAAGKRLTELCMDRGEIANKIRAIRIESYAYFVMHMGRIPTTDLITSAISDVGAWRDAQEVLRCYKGIDAADVDDVYRDRIEETLKDGPAEEAVLKATASFFAH